MKDKGNIAPRAVVPMRHLNCKHESVPNIALAAKNDIPRTMEIHHAAPATRRRMTLSRCTTPATKFALCHDSAQQSQCDYHGTLKCCACHEKWTWTSPNRCACQEGHLKNIVEKSIAPVAQNDFDTLSNTSTCHEVPHLTYKNALHVVSSIQK